MSGQNMQGGQGWYGGQGPMGRGVMQPPQINRQMPGFASRFGNRGAMPPGWFGGPGTQMPGQTQWALNQYGGSPVGTGDMFGQINLPQGFQPPSAPPSPFSMGWTEQNGYLIPPGGFPTATAPMPLPPQTGGTAPNYGAMNPLTAGMINGGM